jgi:diguanylate cyclase (GGDEF)-like protein
VAKTLKKVGRKGDIIGRIGGDEFGYILLEASEEETRSFAFRLQESLPVLTFGKTKIKPTISIGIASSTNVSFKKYQEIYRAADDALHLAKGKKNFITFFNGYLKGKKQGHQISPSG